MPILAELPATEFPDERDWGPKFRALANDRMRMFAWLMGCGMTNASAAARRAGYKDSQSIAVRAHELLHNPRVVDAIEEAGRTYLRTLGPLAIGAAKEVLKDKRHPAHARMIEVVLDRSGYASKTEHKVTVERTIDTSELEALAERLALEAGIEPGRLLGGGPVGDRTRQIGTGPRLPVIEQPVVNVREDPEL